MAMENVVSINKGDQTNFYQCYKNWMLAKKRRSVETYRTYDRTCRRFVRFALDKEINEVGWEELEGITNIDFEKFRNHLIDGGLIVSSIKNYMTHLSWLWKKLHVQRKSIDAMEPNLDALKDERDELCLGSDSLTDQEMELLIDYAKTVSYHPNIQSLFFEFQIQAPLRFSAMKRVAWKDIRQVMNHDEGRMVWSVGIHDKNGWHENQLSDDLCERLLVLKTILHKGCGFKNRPEDPIFYISREKLMKTIEDFKTKYGINKWITPQSFRKTGIEMAFDMFGGDLRAVQAYSGHKTFTMPLRYAKRRQRLNGGMTNVFGDRAKIMEAVTNAPHDQLVDIIKRCGFGVTNAIYQKLDTV
jgi:integrase